MGRMDGVTGECSRCLTTPEPTSQMDAALDAVRQTGLNHREEVSREWFDNAAQGELLRKRLDMLKH